jgi:hypothetical protein
MAGAVRLDPYLGERPASRSDQLRAMWPDGRLLIGFGLFLLGVALPEAIRWVAGADGRVVAFPMLVAVGLGAVLWGLSQRRTVHRQARTAIIVAALDPAGPPGGDEKLERAVAHGRRRHELTVAVRAELSGNAGDLRIAEQVAADAIRMVGLADRVSAGTQRINLTPVMRLHLGFWFGAHLGRSHATPIGVWQPTRGNGGYYLALMLTQPGPAPEASHRADPPFVPSVESFTEGQKVRVALAVSVRPRDAASEERIRAKCRATGVDQVLWLRSRSDGLPPDTATFTAALDQVEREWRDRLPAAAASYVAFLDTTIALAVGIGAQLAGTEPNRWTAYTRDGAGNGGFVQFPPAEVE